MSSRTWFLRPGRVVDHAEIGWYDVRRVTFDPADGELRIVSNIPCEIIVECDELDIEFAHPR